MQICLDKNNRCTGYANIGTMENSINVNIDIPEDFCINCQDYLFIDGAFIHSPLNKAINPSIEERIAALEAIQLEQILGGL